MNIHATLLMVNEVLFSLLASLWNASKVVFLLDCLYTTIARADLRRCGSKLETYILQCIVFGFV